MSAWSDRVSVETAAGALRAALQQNLLDPEEPCAVFHDLGAMRARMDEIAARFPKTALHTIAIKANPIVEVLKAIVARGFGLEAASIEEVYLALAAGCPPPRVVFDSPAKTERELEAALAIGVRVNADNVAEIDRIAAILARAPSTSAIGVRVNPLVGKGTIDITSVSTRSSKFGIPIDMDRDEFAKIFADHPWITGLHVHAGSQGLGVQMLTEAVTRVTALLTDLNRRLGAQRITTLDIGGGLPARYRDSDHLPTLDEYATALKEAVPAIFAPPITLVTELGRAVQGPSGWAVSRVEYVKRAGDEQLAVIHLGADFLLRWVYQPDHWHHDLAVLDAEGREKTGPRAPWSIVGPLCFAGDVLTRGVLLPAIDPGDFVLIRDVGAYTMSMWSRYCSRSLPVVLGHDEGAISVLKPRETPEDIVAFWSGKSAAARR